jgi:hypothetical protein
MIQLRADFLPFPGWKGHLLYERLEPGDFYAGDDAAWFLRFELIYAFEKSPRRAARAP